MGDPLGIDNTYPPFFGDISFLLRGNRGITAVTSHNTISKLEIIIVLY
jgi:hypothetical protein